MKAMNGSSNMMICKSSIEADNADVFVEDVMLEIFVRLPLKSIFKFRCVSKVWFTLLSKPSFVTKWKTFNNYTPWVLFAIVESVVSTKSLNLHSQFISEHDGFSFNFLSRLNPYKPAPIYPLASSNGLVLCSTILKHQYKYYVCNPLTKQWISLRNPRNRTGRVIHGFICESSSSLAFFANLSRTKKKKLVLSSTSFKVVLVPELYVGASTVFDLEIFSSETGEWNTYKVSCPQGFDNVEFRSIRSNAVVHNGVLYWLGIQDRFRKRVVIVVAYELSNTTTTNNNNKCAGQCRLIELPNNDDIVYDLHRHFGESDGFIYYSECGKGEFRIWLLDEDCCSSTGESAWSVVHNIKSQDMLLPENFATGRTLNDLGCARTLDLVPLAFNPLDRNVVILDIVKCSLSRQSFAYNIKTNRLEELNTIHNSLRCGRMEYGCVPFSFAPWPTSL